jgi:PAS domain S-box-containing protein
MNIEKIVSQDDMIVSVTDLEGNIEYVNDILVEKSGYSKEELLGASHNILRHKDMPKAVFKYIWDKIRAGEAVEAYVKNKTKNNDYYWVKAVIVPIKKKHNVVGYVSYRKGVNDYVKEVCSSLYKELIEYEKTNTIDKSVQKMFSFFQSKNLTYEQFISRLDLGEGIELCGIIDIEEVKMAHLIFEADVKTKVIFKELDNFSVKKHTECDFGSILNKHVGRPYTNTYEWRNIVGYHQEIHQTLEAYVEHAKRGEEPKYLKNDLDKVNDMISKVVIEFEKLMKNYKG